MTTPQLIAFIRRFNRWRRSDEAIDMPDPQKIGEALDAICALCELQQRQLESAEDLILRMADTRKPTKETSNKLP